MKNSLMSLYIAEEACPAGLHHSGFACGNHQPKIDFRKRTLRASILSQFMVATIVGTYIRRTRAMIGRAL